MRWRLILEEYAPEFIYLKGETNIVADALSRLELCATPAQSFTDMHDMHYLADHFGLEDDDLPADAYPLHYKTIALHQRQQKDLLTKVAQNHDGFHLKAFCGGGKK
jgi:hypothetical protein